MWVWVDIGARGIASLTTMTSLSADRIRTDHQRHAALAEDHRARSSPVDRILALVHHYVALLGDPQSPLASFEELFANEFVLDFASGRITTFAGFEEWVDAYTSSTIASTLTLEHIDVVDNGDSTLTSTIDFEWDGVMIDGTLMEMGTRHVWHVSDDPHDAFARIRSIAVTKTREMAPRPAR